MGGGADFTDRVENAGARLVHAAVDDGDVRICGKRFFCLGNVDRAVDRQQQIDVIDMIGTGNFNGSCGIRTVIEDQDLFPCRHEGTYGDIDIHGAGAAEEDADKFFRVSVYNFNQVQRHLMHDVTEFLFTRTDVGDNLRVFYGVGRCGRTRIHENIPFYIRIVSAIDNHNEYLPFFENAAASASGMAAAEMDMKNSDYLQLSERSVCFCRRSTVSGSLNVFAFGATYSESGSSPS